MSDGAPSRPPKRLAVEDAAGGPDEAMQGNQEGSSFDSVLEAMHKKNHFRGRGQRCAVVGVTGAISQLDRANQHQFSDHEPHLLELRTQVRTLEDKFERDERKTSELDVGLAEAASVELAPANVSVEYEREIDATIIKARANEPVSVDALQTLSASLGRLVWLQGG